MNKGRLNKAIKLLILQVLKKDHTFRLFICYKKSLFEGLLSSQKLSKSSDWLHGKKSASKKSILVLGM